MTDKKNQFKKKKFPIGIFLLLFIVELSISGSLLYYHFMNNGKKAISEIETRTLNYSKTLVESYSELAALSYKTKNWSNMKRLFSKKTDKTYIKEIFFTLRDGKIAAHSNKKLARKVKHNIFNDEFYYNSDLILKGVLEKKKKTWITNYNLQNVKNPFDRYERDLIKRYLYKDINQPGWLVSKTVFLKRKPIGTINVLSSREDVTSFIKKHISSAVRLSIISLIFSFSFSMLISIIVLVRYRSIEKKALKFHGNSNSSIKNREVIVKNGAIDKKDKISNPITLIEKGDKKSSNNEKEEFISISLVDDDLDDEIIDETDNSKNNIIPIDSKLEKSDLFDKNKNTQGIRKIYDALPVSKKEVN